MRVVFITSNYPSSARPHRGTFVQQFVWAMARQGHECTVINPGTVFDLRHGEPLAHGGNEDAGGSVAVRVLRPPFVSFSSRDLLFTHTGRWTQRSFNIAVRSAVRRGGLSPQVVVGHFLYLSGYAATLTGRTYGCPSVVAVGESSPWTIAAFGQKAARRHFAENGAFLANSNPNKEMLVELLGIQPARIIVEPNGVDLSFMKPRVQADMRRRNRISGDGFVVSFAGSGEVRKGAGRVVEALKGLDEVQCILMGAGTEQFASESVLRSGPVSHQLVPELLCCADIFVLPTLSEGSCNAVIEAMACGLPIVTSNGRYMDDIVDDEVAIRVDPSNVGEIRAAIQALKDDPERRRQMSEACLKKANQFDINERARRVTAWMEELVRAYQA